MLSVAVDFDQQCRNNFLIAISNKYLFLGARRCNRADRAALRRPGHSGDYERVMIVDSRRYLHIIDPVSGWPVESFVSVSVVTGSASSLAPRRRSAC
jgi:hypothetical protein